MFKFLKSSHPMAKLLAGASLMVMASGASNAQDSDSETSLVLEEIIVTATKRAKSIDDIPFSIAAFDETSLGERGINGFSDLAVSVPGLSLQEGGPGNRAIIVRGISSTGVSVNASATGYYYDEAFIEPAGITQSIIEPIFFDIERVEVLRGPQGTLFGGSSMGGTVRFISNKPNLYDVEAAAGGRLSFTRDGGTNYQINGMLNMPIVEDKLGIRVVGSYTDDSGFIDRVQDSARNPAGIGFDQDGIEENINSANNIGARAIVTFNPTETLSLQATVTYQQVEQDSLPGANNINGDLTYTTPFNIDEFIEDEFIMGNFVATLELDNFQILSSTTYYDRDTDFIEDGSTTFFSVAAGGIPLFGGGPREDTALIQELRVSTTWGKPLNFVAGVYYEEYERDVLSEFTTFDLGTGSEVFVPAFAPFTIQNRLEREQMAAFFEATYDLTEKWELTLGLRFFDFEITDVNVFLAPNAPITSSESGVSPRASIAYRPDDKSTYYATVSRGFRPGGPNFGFPAFAVDQCQAAYAQFGIEVGDDGSADAFQSDDLWNFEVGGKTRLFDSRVSISGAAYHIRWDDLQELAFLPACGAGGLNLNAGRADVYGAELEFDVLVTKEFNIFGGVNYNSSELAEDTAIPFGNDGTPISNAPEWTANLNAKYETDIGDYTGFAIANFRHVGESFRTFGDFAVDPQVTQGDFQTVGLRFGLMAENWQVSIFADNLTDDNSNATRLLSTFEPLPASRFTPIRPRTIGLEFRITY